MNLTKSKELFLKIYDDEKMCCEIENYIAENERKVKIYLFICRKNKWELIYKKSAKLKLAVLFVLLNEVYEKYKEKGINDEVFFDTMSDIKIWINDYKEKSGEWGLEEINWLKNHYSFSIFKLGRLQFQLTRYFGTKITLKSGKEINTRDKVLFIHIPRGEVLSKEKCEQSFEMSKKFFSEFFPEYCPCTFMCCSWLLYEKNKNFMKQGSNILSFCDFFEVVKNIDLPWDTYRWVYGMNVDKKQLIINKKKTGSYGLTQTMPQNTSLQKSLTDYIIKGGTLGVGLGVVK